MKIFHLLILVIMTINCCSSVNVNQNPYIASTYFYYDKRNHEDYEQHNMYLQFTSNDDLASTAFQWEFDHKLNVIEIAKFREVIMIWKLGKAFIDEKKLYFKFDFDDISIIYGTFNYNDSSNHYEFILKTGSGKDFTFGVFTKEEDFPEKRPLNDLLQKIKHAKEK